MATDRQAPGPESIGYGALGGMRVDAGGHVTYDFDGHVHAKGLDLDAGTTGAQVATTPPADSIVRWLRTSNGALVAELYGTRNPAQGQHEARLRATGAGGGANVVLRAEDGDWPNETRLTLFNDPTITGQKVIQAQAGVHSKTLLDGARQSDFVQVKGGPPPLSRQLDIGWNGPAFLLEFYVDGTMVKTL